MISSTLRPVEDGVGQGQLDLLVRPDDEARAHRKRVVGVGVDHVVKVRHLAVLIADQREGEGRTLRLLDVPRPTLVGLDQGANFREADQLGVALVEFRLRLRGERPQLGRADRA